LAKRPCVQSTKRSLVPPSFHHLLPPSRLLHEGSRSYGMINAESVVRSIATCVLRMRRLSRMRTWCFLAVVQWVSLISAR
jgi:hypothetical protein